MDGKMPDHITDGPMDDCPITCKSYDCDEQVKDEDEYCPECWQAWQESMYDSRTDR